MKIEFDIYKKNDFDEFKKMVSALYKEDAYGEKITDRKIKKTISELSANSDQGEIYIFKRMAKTVGYAIIIYYWSNEYGGHIAFIDELYVKPQFRSQGIATQFLEFIITKNKRDIKLLQLEVTKANEKAIGFYRKNGFTLNENLSMIQKL